MHPAPMLVLLTVLAAGCAPSRPDRSAPTIPGSDPARGERLLAQYQCGRCHRLSDVPAADGVAAPPLDGWARRSYIAGRVQNDPQNLQRWLQSPRSVVPTATMPDLGVPPADARDMAAHLLARR